MAGVLFNNARKKNRRPSRSPELFCCDILLLPATIVIGCTMLFKVINFFLPVVFYPTAPATNRDDGADTDNPPLVGIELAAVMGRERALSHG